MPENKMKIFLAICFFLIAVLAYNDRQNVMRQETMHQTAVIPSIDNVYRAIENDDTGLLKKLFAAGADMEDAKIWQEINTATGESHETKGLTPLGYAVYMNHPKAAGWLVDNGADVNAPMPVGGSIFSWAVFYRMKEVIIKLLERGGMNWDEGYNPANQARGIGHEDIVSLLASYGIYPTVGLPDMQMKKKMVPEKVFNRQAHKKTLEK